MLVFKIMINQNLGMLDRIFRFVLGILWLSPMAPQFSIAWINTLITAVAWIFLVESLIGWCGLHKLFGINNKNQ